MIGGEIRARRQDLDDRRLGIVCRDGLPWRVELDNRVICRKGAVIKRSTKDTFEWTTDSGDGYRRNEDVISSVVLEAIERLNVCRVSVEPMGFACGCIRSCFDKHHVLIGRKGQVAIHCRTCRMSTQ
jgi:hypothetical protein